MDDDLIYTDKHLRIEQFKPNFTMNFNREDGEKVAELDWSDGTLKFSGNIEKSAEIFLDFLKPYLDEYVKIKEAEMRTLKTTHKYESSQKDEATHSCSQSHGSGKEGVKNG